MNQGAALWENASNVNFTHVSSQDGNCWTGNNSVLFSVEPTFTTQYIARAFFPSSPDSQRNVLVNADSLQSSGSWTPGNILGHELGHTLGFRHEHTRPEAGTCFEDNNWYPLTPYDSVVDHALPAVQRRVRRPAVLGVRRAGRGVPLRAVTAVTG